MYVTDSHADSKANTGLSVGSLQARALVSSKFFSSSALHSVVLNNSSLSPYVNFLEENSTISTDVFKQLLALREIKSPSEGDNANALLYNQHNKNWSFEKFMVVLASKLHPAKVVSCVPYWFLTEGEATVLFDFFTSRKKNGVLARQDFSLFSKVVAALIQNKALPTSFAMKALEFAPTGSSRKKALLFYTGLIELISYKGLQFDSLAEFLAGFEKTGFSFSKDDPILCFLSFVNADFKKAALCLKSKALHVAAASSLFLDAADVEFLISLDDVSVLEALGKNPAVSLATLRKVKTLLENHCAFDSILQLTDLIRVYDSSFLLRLHAKSIRENIKAMEFAVIDTLKKYAKEGVSLSSEEKVFVSRVKNRVYSTIPAFKGVQTKDSVCLNFTILQGGAKLLGFSDKVLKEKFAVSDSSSSSTSHHRVYYNQIFYSTADTDLVAKTLVDFCALDVRKWELVLSLLDDSSLPLYEFCDMITSLL